MAGWLGLEDVLLVELLMMMVGHMITRFSK